jgi:hypothetical protein
MAFRDLFGTRPGCDDGQIMLKGSGRDNAVCDLERSPLIWHAPASRPHRSATGSVTGRMRPANHGRSAWSIHWANSCLPLTLGKNRQALKHLAQGNDAHEPMRIIGIVQPLLHLWFWFRPCQFGGNVGVQRKAGHSVTGRPVSSSLLKSMIKTLKRGVGEQLSKTLAALRPTVNLPIFGGPLHVEWLRPESRHRGRARIAAP